jgi:hypothetical protein
MMTFKNLVNYLEGGESLDEFVREFQTELCEARAL